MKYFYSAFFFFIACFGFGQNNSKQFSFKDLTIEHGLSQNSVISIAQDSIGYMWFATQDGLNKYDGRTFTYFNKQFEDITRPTFSKLGKVYVDKQNYLWIISNSGKLEKFNQKEQVFKHIKNIELASSIYQDNRFNMYIGTYGKGLFKIDNRTKDTLQIFKNKDFNKTCYGFIQLNNRLFVAASGSVFSIQNNNYEPIKVEDNHNSNFSVLAKTNNNTVWVGTYGQGLFHKTVNSDSFVAFNGINKSKLPKNLNIEDLLTDKQNRLWIATYGQGVFLIDFKLETINHFTANKTDPYAIHYNDVLSLYEDYTGVIWLGTDGAGASYYDEYLSKFNVLTNNQTPDNVNLDVIRSITVDNNDNLWIGTSGKGLTFINLKKQEFKTITAQNSALKSNRIISLQFINDELWIGHQGFGLNILNASGNFEQYPETSQFTIWRIVKDTNKQQWLGTENNGLLLFNKEKGILKQYTKENSALTTNNIRAIEKGNDGILWVGTEDKGLYKLDRTTETFSKIENVQDKIKSLFFKNDVLWIGTNGNGLKRYNTLTQEIQVFTKNDGLPNNVIYGILPDEDNNLWLSSNAGITKFNNSQNKEPVIENYSNYDGLQALEFNTGAYYKDNKGTLYFGGLEGINWFIPSQLTFNKVKPKTVISNVEIFNKDQDIIQNEKFKSKQSTFTFTFSGLHFSQPERNSYKYKLVNHDKDWIDSGNNNVAHYTNLPANDYEFQAISSNYDGVWNTEPATYSFTILKPWYATNFAKAFYLFLLLSTIFGVYKYFKWRWQIKLQLEIEHAETERLMKLDEFKTKLYTNISHEFRTPLTLISSPIQDALNNDLLSEKKRVQFEMAQRNSERLLSLIDQLLDLSKIESGNLKLHIQKGNVQQLIAALSNSFSYSAEQKEIVFLKNVKNDALESWFDKDAIEKIVINILSNAIKYTPANGSIVFNSFIENDTLKLEVKNTGNGIHADDLNNIFQRFYQTNEQNQGSGIGLSLVKELVELHKGSITVKSEPNQWTTFNIVLPIDKSSFTGEQFTSTSNDEINNRIPKIANLDIETEDEFVDSKLPILLVVEDNADLRTLIKQLFEAEYNVITASNGKLGVELAIEYIPDLIISDVLMPIKDGIALTIELKNDERTTHIPIILLTAKAGKVDELEGTEMGADDYITKPFDKKLLSIKVKNLIESRKKLQSRYSQEVVLMSKDISITSIDEIFLEKVQKVLEIKLVESSFSIEDFSKAVGLSRMQLHRKIKALTGLSASEFIRSQRLKLAAQLLKKSDINISQVGYTVGFNDHSYFTKCFKEAYNCTPTDFSKQKS